MKTRNRPLQLLFMCLLFCLLTVSGWAQRVTLKFNNARFETVLTAIKAQTKYALIFSEQLVDVNRKVSINVVDVPLDQALNQLLKGTTLGYEIKNQQLYLVAKQSQETAANVVHKITGSVVDERKEPVIGASVYIKGTSKGTSTNMSGDFTFLAKPGDILVVSYIGYATQEHKITNQTVYNFVLAKSSLDLEAVVMIGYGTTTRKEITGSVTSVNMTNSPIANLPNINALDNLKGNVPGLDVGMTNDVREQPSILIRGQNSIGGGTSPLIVLDGVIYPGSLRDINPNDIESYDILKDAVSAAVYGSRSANGVIAITTKKGKKGKPVINFNTSFASSHWQNRPELRKGMDNVRMVNATSNRDPENTVWMAPQMIDNMNAGREVDWLDAVSRNGFTQKYQVSVSGAGDRMNYYISTSLDKSKGLIVGNDYDRYSILMKLQTDITDWFKFGVDAAYSRRNPSVFGADLQTAYAMMPYGSMYRDENGNLEKFPQSEGKSLVNPLWGVNDGTEEGYNVYNVYDLNASATFTLPWDKGLTFRTSVRYNLTERDDAHFVHENAYVLEGPVTDASRYSPATVQKYLSNANGKIVTEINPNYVVDFVLNYKRSYKEHNFNFTAVATRDEYKNSVRTLTGSDFKANGNTLLGYMGMEKATVQKVKQGESLRRDIGYLGRLNYNYKNTYFLTGSYRRDGASVFGADNKWGSFYAIGGAWTLTNEKFMKSFKPLSYFKLKASWGQNGNQGVDPYGTLAKVTNGASSGKRYEFGDTGSTIYYGIVQNNLGNGVLGWESTSKLNIGFESAWFKDRLRIDADFYTSNTTDELYAQGLPPMTGFGSILSSLGEVSNKGVEVTVNSQNIVSKAVNWSTTVTFWLNRNKLLYIDGTKDENGKYADKLSSGMFIGHPLGAIYGYRYDGVIQADDIAYKSMPGASVTNGFPKYVDLDGNGEINDKDREILGYKQPSFKLNMSNTVTYKDFELYVMVAGVFGSKKYFQASNKMAYITKAINGFNGDASIDYYTDERPSKRYLAPTFTNDGKFLGLQSRTFVRIQNISLSYTFRQNWVQKMKIQNLKVFVTANNPVVFTGWEGGDPEAGIGAQSTDYPVASTYSVGLNLNF